MTAEFFVDRPSADFLRKEFLIREKVRLEIDERDESKVELRFRGEKNVVRSFVKKFEVVFGQSREKIFDEQNEKSRSSSRRDNFLRFESKVELFSCSVEQRNPIRRGASRPAENSLRPEDFDRLEKKQSDERILRGDFPSRQVRLVHRR